MATRVAEIENPKSAVSANISVMPNLESKIQEMEGQVGGMLDAKIAAAVATLTVSGGIQAPISIRVGMHDRSSNAKLCKTSTESSTRKGTARGIER